MISSAQVLNTPRATRRNRELAYAASNRYMLPTRASSVNPKLAVAAGAISLIVLVTIILTHMGTYDVALTRSSVQTDVQATVTDKSQTTTQQPGKNATTT